jgi:para-aminobenzoate synthetase / 4-amino-4-deoxychorismate lyase
MVEAMFGSSDIQTKGLRLRFTSPLTAHSATQLEEVVPLLNAVDAAAKSGCWAVLMLSYEAAPAFDDALKTHTPGFLPLAWAAVFAKPEMPSAPPAMAPEFTAGRYNLTGWESEVSRSEYSEAVMRIRNLITRGDTYQVNYTVPLRSHFNGDPGAWYDTLVPRKARSIVPTSIWEDTKSYVSRRSSSSSATSIPSKQSQ